MFVSVANRDKRHAIFPIKRLADLGFTLWATEGTASMLELHDVKVNKVRKHSERAEASDVPTITELISAGEIDLIFNTPTGETQGGSPRMDGYAIRTAAILGDVPIITTVQGLEAAVQGIESLRKRTIGVRSLQEWGSEMRGARRS